MGGVVGTPETPAVKAKLAVVGETAGAWLMVRIKVCGTVPTVLVAARVRVIGGPEPAGGVPLRTPLVVSVSQIGSVLEVLKFGKGEPLAVSVKVPWLPAVKVVAATLVKAGISPTKSVKVWVALAPTPFVATMFSVKGPLCSGVPLSKPALVKVTPVGRVLAVLKLGVGKPLAVKVKLPALPVWKPVLLLLVIAACSFTLKVKLCVAAAPTPLLAVIVTMLTPPLLAKGVPEMTPVVEFNCRPLGSVPLVKVGAGKPVAVTVKLPEVPTV